MTGKSTTYNTDATVPGSSEKTMTDSAPAKEKKRQLKGPKALQSVKESRKLARLVEEDKLRHNVRKEQAEERTLWKQPGGFEKRMEKYFPNEGEYENPALNFLMSSDPLSGVSQMAEDAATYGATLAQDNVTFGITNLRIRKIFANRGMTYAEAKALGEIVTNEARYGTDAMDSARQTYFVRQRGAEAAEADGSDNSFQPL